MTKLYPSAQEALAGIARDGMLVAVGGFGLCGIPEALNFALRATGVHNLTVASNNAGVDGWGLGLLLESRQIRKMISSYVGENAEFERQFLAGEVEVEFAPQGTLAERMRAAGAGIPAFYTPTAVGTELAVGRETRVINGREYLLEYALPLDYAFVRATRADTFGNLLFHRSQRNFCPVMATAARIAIAEVDEDIVPAGTIDPDQVHTPGIFVHRVVKVPPPPDGLWPTRRQERRR